MGMQAQGQQLGTQVFYDAESGQYYTQSPQPKNGMGQLFGRILGVEPNQKNYLTNFNNQSIAARPTPAFTPIDIAALFPQLSQAATGVPASSLLGAEGVVPVEGESKGAAKAASSGAGRFM